MNENQNLESSESQNKRILAYLRNGETITSLESVKLFECMRLASRMTDLKQSGVNIKTATVTKQNGNGRPKRFSAYFIPEAVIKRYGCENAEKKAYDITMARINE